MADNNKLDKMRFENGLAHVLRTAARDEMTYSAPDEYTFDVAKRLAKERGLDVTIDLNAAPLLKG